MSHVWSLCDIETDTKTEHPRGDASVPSFHVAKADEGDRCHTDGSEDVDVIP